MADLKYLQLIRWLTNNGPVQTFPSHVISELAETKLAYFENISQLHNLAGFGIRIESITRMMQHVGDIALVNLYGTMDVSSEEMELANAKIKAEMAKVRAQRNYSHLGNSNAIETSATHIDLLARERKEIENGLTAVMEAIITAGWTAFEVLASDLWEAAINANPRHLADLRGNGKRINKMLGGAKTSDVDTGSFGNDGPSKAVQLGDIHRVTQGSFDLDNKWGTLLKHSFKFSTLTGIREAYSKAFDRNSSAIDDCLANKSLNSLSLVRNLLVHKSGIADVDYIDKQPDAPNAPALYFGIRIPIDGELVESLVAPPLECGNRLLAAVNDWLITARRDDEKGVA
ncbi:hypothetical protein ETAA8_71090 [Anatilimnocola aggregata]|uniref:Uncharacterized protein n=1 Tax=Anatilimnocola aggregata TaxID=2528021 RepID=A0A517YNZ5_9BACT|nr:hypothetical protein [Anatilimnocola aggregata]QDU31947.1 hypothetical protein ETAA8_71090 [Anatilimnocola aggregata]